MGTIKSNQVKVCDSTMHACVLNTTGNIVQYIYCTVQCSNVNKMHYTFKINTSLQGTGDTFGMERRLRLYQLTFSYPKA